MIGESGFENITWFMGLVEDNNDPIAGRVKVRCFGFHPPFSDGLVDTADLPWAHVVRDSKFASVPDNGDLVIGFFMDGRDAQHPMVMGVINSAKFSLPTSNMPGGVGPGYKPVAAGPGYGGTERAKYAYNYFIQRGFTPEQAAGIVGNLQAESGENLDDLYNPNDLGKPAYGIAQWRDTRAETFRQVYGIYPNDASIDQQLDFIMYEFNTTESKAFNSIKSTSTVTEAASAFDSKFERSDGSTIGSRIANANALLSELGGAVTTTQFENGYLAPSTDAVNNYGNNAMPPQMSGEGLQNTPALVQATARKTVQFSAASGGYTADEPGVPVSGSTKTSVWSMRHGGSYIELAGKEADKEFINITHASGSRVTLDANGNVSIKAFGKLHLSSEGVIEELSDSTKAAIHRGGYILDISGGNADITVDGNLNFSATGDINFGAGRKITMSSGDTIDVMGSKVAITAKTDAIDIMAAQKLALSSHGTGLSIASVDGLYLQSSGGAVSVKSKGAVGLAGETVGIQSSGVMKVKGSQIYLNSAGQEPPDVPDSLSAIGAFVPNPPRLGVATPTKPIPTPTDTSPAMLDESTGPR